MISDISSLIFLHEENNYYPLIIGILLFSILLLLSFIYFDKKRNKYKLLLKYYNISNENLINIYFSEIESELIKKIIINNSLYNKKTNVEEINVLLGVANKSIDIQKKKRSDIISSINNKYCILVNRKDIFLINRIRVENDRRVYEYFISPDQIIEVEKYLI